MVSLGTENDNGGGLSEEGIQQLKLIVSGYGIDLYRPNSLEESIETKLDILLSRKVDLLINIGGNQTSFGTCIHSSSIPNGLHRNLKTCLDENRGIIARLSEKGIPFVNLLNIKNLAVENNISINPSITSSKLLYTERNTNKIPLVISIVILSAFLILIRERKYSC